MFISNVFCYVLIKNCLNEENLMGKRTSPDLLRHAQALNAMTTPMKKYFGVSSDGVSVFR